MKSVQYELLKAAVRLCLLLALGGHGEAAGAFLEQTFLWTAEQDGTVLYPYEGGENSAYQSLRLARFNLEWLTEAGSK